jgi:hypothetical protein
LRSALAAVFDRFCFPLADFDPAGFGSSTTGAIGQWVTP